MGEAGVHAVYMEEKGSEWDGRAEGVGRPCCAPGLRVKEWARYLLCVGGDDGGGEGGRDWTGHSGIAYITCIAASRLVHRRGEGWEHVENDRLALHRLRQRRGVDRKCWPEHTWIHVMEVVIELDDFTCSATEGEVVRWC